LIEQQSDSLAWRVYIRPEGSHFVGLCAELKAVITGATIEDVVNKIKVLAAKARSRIYGPAREAHVAVHVSPSIQR
jgi:hypothetical protein